MKLLMLVQILLILLIILILLHWQVKKVLSGEAQFGILICGTGIGISIAANKIKGIRAALAHNEFTAKLSRLHNDANIIALGARVLGDSLAIACVETFINTEFEGGRHARRVGKIEKE